MNGRVYRLRPPDRTGWTLGLSGPQTVTIGVTVVVLTVGVSRGLPVPAAVGLAATGAALGLVRVTGTPLITELPHVSRWATAAIRPPTPWYAPVPLQTKGTALPEVLAGQRLLAVKPADHGFPARAAPIGVISDAREGLVAATLRASSRQFALLDPADQDRLLAGWADALRPLCREHNPIQHLRWSEWTAPAGISEHEAWLDAQATEPSRDVDQYRALLTAAGPLATRHEILLTLTVRTDRVRVEARHRHDRTRAAVEFLIRELRLLGERLERAGITNHGPLGPTETIHSVKIRLDPMRIGLLETVTRTLSQRTGAVVGDDLPDVTCAAESTWRYWRTDDAVHRSFHLRGWPRNELTASWLAPLLLQPGITRTVTVAYQPIAPTVSRRAVQRQAAKVDADAQHRADKGFRVGADHRWAARAVAEREEELASGHAELAYTGILTVTAPTVEALEHDCTELQQTAAACGIEMQPLNGRHDLAVVASLPLARGIAARRQW